MEIDMLHYEALWTVQHIRDGQVIWEIRDKKNLLMNEGQRAILETFFRDRGSNYFGMTNFWIGMFRGTVSKTTVLSTIPNEPSGNGYVRQEVERSAVGFPTIEQVDGDWRIVSKETIMTATGGDVGPVNGAFLCTSSDNTGILVGSLSFGIERTVMSGDEMIVKMKIKVIS